MRNPEGIMLRPRIAVSSVLVPDGQIERDQANLQRIAQAGASIIPFSD